MICRQQRWMARLSSGVSSWKTRGATRPVLVEQRNTFVMPFGHFAAASSGRRAGRSRGRAIHLAELHEAVGAEVDDLVNPEAVAEVRHLDHDRRLARGPASRGRRPRPDWGRRPTRSQRLDVVGEHGEVVERRRMSGPDRAASLTGAKARRRL